jgi:serine/threonine protein kinase
VIGQGMTSAVLEALDVQTGKDYAIKIMSYSDLEDRNLLPMIEHELTILRRLSHPNVLQFHEFLRQGDLLLLITEHCNNGDLLSWIVDGRLNDKLTIKRIFYEVSLAIQYLHRQGIAHCDIKPENVIIDSSGTVKLIDFGCATQCTFAGDNTKNGTLLYAAPELLQRGKYQTQKVDIWALAILLYVMVTGKFPFNQNDDHQIVNQIRHGKLRFPGEMDHEIERFIRKMAKVNPNERPSIDRILEDTFFDPVRVEQKKNETGRTVRASSVEMEMEFDLW